jgi:antitoxin HicB
MQYKDAKLYLEKLVNETIETNWANRSRGDRTMKYTIVIQWSEEDRCFVVFVPEFEDVMQPVTHGDSYEEAIYNAREVLELLIESGESEGKPLPAIKKIERLFQAA